MSEQYNNLKQTVEKMSEANKLTRLNDIRMELFVFANSYAGDETGHLACTLHEACNCILRVTACIKPSTEGDLP